MKSVNSLKKLVLTLAAATSLAITSYGIDAWQAVAGAAVPPPNYKVEIVNNGTHEVNIAGSAHLLNVPGLPASLVVDPNPLILDFNEPDVQTLVHSLDHESQFHDVNSVYWNWCNGIQWQDPIYLDFMISVPDVLDPNTTRCFMVHIEFCMEQKCSSLSTSPYVGSRGYVRIVFTDATV